MTCLPLEAELASVRLALRKALAERGEDYVYVAPEALVYDDETDEVKKVRLTSCVYAEPVFDEDDRVTDLVPSCLWGHVLATLGVSVELLRDEDDAVDVLPYLPWRDQRISQAARVSQSVQDGAVRESVDDEACTWGKAVEAFEDELKARGVTA